MSCLSDERATALFHYFQAGAAELNKFSAKKCKYIPFFENTSKPNCKEKNC